MISDPVNAKEFLRSIPIFGGLEDKPLERLCQLLEEQSVPKGTVVCKQGETGRSMFIVREGEVLVRRAGDHGQLIRVVRMGKGEFFGESTLIEIHARSASVVVEKPARLLTLTNKDLLTLYREDPHAYVMIVMNLARELSRRLRRAENRICELAEQVEDDRTQILSER